MVALGCIAHGFPSRTRLPGNEISCAGSVPKKYEAPSICNVFGSARSGEKLRSGLTAAGYENPDTVAGDSASGRNECSDLLGHQMPDCRGI